MTLYWGVRAERDLYAHAALESLARRTPGFRYVPVLSEPSAGLARGSPDSCTRRSSPGCRISLATMSMRAGRRR